MKRDALERFMEKVTESPDGCWLWSSSVRPNGYGEFHYEGRTVLAHRWVYARLAGPIPDGLQLDHLCRVRACVNPDHLEPVTQRENLLRGESPSAVHARKTHCPNGHDYELHGKRNPRGDRRCRTCERERWAQG